jgi:predicted ATPase/transcriptional regulator with GAF, ATPase, and Fis domain
MDIPGYDLLGDLLRTRTHVLSRAIRRADGSRVLVKRQTSPDASPGALQRELDAMRQHAFRGVPRVIELIRSTDGECLVVEDRGLTPLQVRPAPGLDDLLSLAIDLCDVLSDLHRRELVLGTVSPATVLAGASGAGVELIDFSLAQRVPVDVQAMAASALIPGRAAYVAPEQTGRISRLVDHRADLYAVGATLYQLLAGRPPFDTEDPLELVHAHIARTPRLPTAIAESVPGVLSEIVMRLLAKGAEDRYQSARGLRHDIERCRSAWRDTGTIARFDLGASDFSDRLLIPQRLYGRDAELSGLTEAFDEALETRPGLVLVGGYSGVGKTSFINELCRPIVRERGYFVGGKFDQVARSVPYGALVQAFRSLIWQVLAESEERLMRWRDELGAAVGSNGGVVASVLPEVEFVIGKQPPPVPLDAVESQNRFRYVFRSFIGTFAQPDHPLVLFLDDLQWADAATLELLHAILIDTERRPLLVIGAYRDNEVTYDHPLSIAIDRLERAGARVRRLMLGPLDEESLSLFLADTLRTDRHEIGSLAALIREKTDGNPFFVIQFLQTLQHDGLLTLDRAKGQWSFDLDRIAAASTTDNVVAFMTQRIQRLSPVAQDVLRLAACIGSPFKWQTFLTATPLDADSAARGLTEALDSGLIRPADSQYEADRTRSSPYGVFAFIHDRVQQAAYALIPEPQRAAVHLSVGRHLRAECGGDVPDDRLFEIANHLNIGRELIAADDERLDLARVNLAAGRHAKASAAFRAALDCLDAGLACCGSVQWESQYALLFPLHLERAECLYLAGDFQAAERALDDLLPLALPPDVPGVHELRVTFYENRSRYGDAIAAGRDGLRLCGITLPVAEDDIDRALESELAAIEHLRDNRTIASLVDLPLMASSETRTAMRLLTLMWAPVYISGNQPLTSLISAAMVRLSLQHGNTEDSAYGFVTHAITIGPVRRRYRDAYEWGELAVAVNERFADTKRRAKIHQQLHAHVKLWRQPFAACIPHAREAARAGLEAGDFAYAGYGAATESWPAWLACRDIGQFVREQTPALAFLGRVGMQGFRDVLRVMIQGALALQGKTAGPTTLASADFDEAEFLGRYSATAPLFIGILRCTRLQLAVIFNDVADALDHVEPARESAIPGTIWPVVARYWGTLATTAAWETMSAHDRVTAAPHVAEAAALLAELADNCPENFRCFALVLRAEQARIEQRHVDAVRHLEEAAAYAATTGNLLHEALACEMRGRALLVASDEPRAADWLTRAHRAYSRWGAAAKARQLKQRHARLLGAVSDLDDAADRRADDPVAAIDVSSVLKVAQAIAGEIEVERLLRTLMITAVENAGAERGIFLQVRDDQAVPIMEARAAGDGVDVRRGLSWDDAGPLAHAVVRYVKRTSQDVVVADAALDDRFAAQAVPTRVQSVLCVPVAQQGRVAGILYLEHGLSGAFTASRTEIVRVLAAQAAIAFENARLYEDMKSEVDRRAAAERALREALAEVEALKNRLEAENVYLQEEIGTQHNFNEIVGNSPPLLEALRKVERVAPTDSTVLILGETGSGKELVARAVHSRSRRNDRPLVKVNCGAIPPGLVESELFGHVKGAFTGAVERRTGRFELANGGTIFLDEIGELPLEAQVKLLRVLQEQEFEPVGSSRTVRVNVRVIAATNRNLAHAVQQGRFRADLLYRLNVFPIEIPALRERSRDVPLLAGLFLSRIARTLGKPLQGVSARSIELLQRYDWPGNVRELQNTLERAAILSEGPIVEVEGVLPEPARIEEATATPKGRLDEVQREHIANVLRATGGVVEGAKGAAVILGMHPNTLRSRMKKLGIQLPSAGPLSTLSLRPSAPPD